MGTLRKGASLRLDHLSKLFGDVVAVDNIDLFVEPGEFLTLLGPSGSGKTTTLAMIGGFLEPSSGEVYVNDTPVSGLPSYKRGLGMVFQNYALFPHMTVFQNIAFPLKLRHLSRAEIASRVRSILEVVRLPGYGHRYPRELSGGQQQRVALARALVFNPEVLLMDEPLGSLDKQLREEMQLEIRRIHEELKVTIISVTHDQEEALTTSDRVAVMNQGRVEQVGSPEDIYERPTTSFVARFIGESNFFKGRVVDIHGKELLCRVDDELVLRSGLTEGICRGNLVTLAVRPERLVFLAGNERLPNMVEGVVEEVVYVGHSLRYQIRLAAGRLLSHKRPGSARGADVRQGDRVRVGWTVDDSITLRSETG